MSNLSPTAEAEACTSEPTAAVLEALPGRLSDLGGLPIRRLLPRSQRRLVGPWCFLDSYGPLTFGSGKPMDVAPHPHIGLQTVSWLLEGEVLHNDSLGRCATAVPGALNLMTAGRGISHAEETPPENRGRLHGVQLWVALPRASRDTAPSFEQHEGLPELATEGGNATVFLGALGGASSPARTFSPIVGAELSGRGDRRLVLPLDPEFEHALVPLRGGCRLAASSLAIDTLYYLGSNRRELALEGDGRDYRALLIGGAPFGESVLMWWNFVAGSAEEILEARGDWEAERRFGTIAAYAGPRIPAPPFQARPVPRA